MKRKITRSQIPEYMSSIGKLTSVKDTKFAIKMLENFDVLLKINSETEKKISVLSNITDQRTRDYINKETEILYKHAEINQETGQPIIDRNSMPRIKRGSDGVYKNDITKLKGDYVDVIPGLDIKKKAINEILAETIEVDLTLYTKENLPETLSINEYKEISKFLQDDVIK